MSTLSTVLFDVDGTLVDSNYVHIATWSRALAEVGEPVDSWRIHRAIGMDSAKLLDALLHERAAIVGQRAKDLHHHYFLEAADRLRPFAGASDLLRTLARNGMRVVLATSAPEDELDVLKKVLEVDDTIAQCTSASDVRSAKPDPDIVHAALALAGATAADAVMVGDSVWDIQSAARAGVPCVAVLAGGTGGRELRDAGAVAVYEDVGDLSSNLGASPLLAR